MVHYRVGKLSVRGQRINTSHIFCESRAWDSEENAYGLFLRRPSLSVGMQSDPQRAD